MTLALIVPNDYRVLPVLVRFVGDVASDGGFPAHRCEIRARTDKEASEAHASLESFSEHGGEILRLHRDDQTPRLGAPWSPR